MSIQDHTNTFMPVSQMQYYLAQTIFLISKRHHDAMALHPCVPIYVIEHDNKCDFNYIEKMKDSLSAGIAKAG
ncbi:MAG: hypothetical protein ACOH2B_09205 [Burkholderiaceae bacterium]